MDADFVILIAANCCYLDAIYCLFSSPFQLGIHPLCKLKELDEDKILKLSQLLNNMKIESELKREVSNRIVHKVTIGCYQGIQVEID